MYASRVTERAQMEFVKNDLICTGGASKKEMEQKKSRREYPTIPLVING